MRCKDLRNLHKQFNSKRLSWLGLGDLGKTFKKQCNFLLQVLNYHNNTVACEYCGGGGGIYVECRGYVGLEMCEACMGHGRVFPDKAARARYAQGPQMRGVLKYVPVVGESLDE